MEKKVFIIFCLVFIFYSGYVFALDSVELKSGKIVEGKIVENTKEKVKIEVSGLTATYYKDDIKSIYQESEGDEFSLKFSTDANETNEMVLPVVTDSNKWEESIEINRHLAGLIGKEDENFEVLDVEESPDVGALREISMNLGFGLMMQSMAEVTRELQSKGKALDEIASFMENNQDAIQAAALCVNKETIKGWIAEQEEIMARNLEWQGKTLRISGDGSIETITPISENIVKIVDSCQ